MLSWFHTTDKGGNHGVAAGEVRGAHRLSAGDGAGMGTLVDRGGKTSHSPLYPPRRSSPRLGLSPRLAQPCGAQKWLAVGGSQRGCDALWCAAFVGGCHMGAAGR